MDIEKILNMMPLEDKIALCSGASFWETKQYEKYDIPSLFMCDGPHGLRKQERADGADMLGVNESRPATCFPAEVTTAGSWDPELLKQIGIAIGEEARDQGVGLVLGPGANLKRNPLCGRNFEYFSEDPYLAGKLAAGFIRGMESQGIGSSLKHFAVNSQEKSRFNSDSVLDERTLRELYLTAFEIAVKEGKPSTVMCSYPKMNGTHCSDSKELLNDILREEWGFDGMVVTDWGAMNDRIEGFKAGCDLNMPGGSNYMEKTVLEAVKNGELPEAQVDASARRALKLVDQAAKTLKTPAKCDYEAHHTLARKAAAEGAVLLKNEDNILPLKENTKIAVIGAMAKNMRYQGAGSSHINARELSQPLEYLTGVFYAPGCDDRGDTTDALIAEAAALAAEAEVAVVFAGLPDRYESEGFDREDMKMPEGHLRMIDAVAEKNPNTVVVLLCGCVVECPWADRVKGILYIGLPGQAGGGAVADLLYGKVNPGGKLAESWPYVYEDVPSSEIYDKTKDALYQEGIYVGYRYYDKADVPVRWPFGYGLSYTSFAYSELKTGENTVTVKVTNTGDRPGAEVVQLYISAPKKGLHRPVRELKDFRKVFLQPGESKNVAFTLNERSFAVWQDGWKIPAGTYRVFVDSLTACVEIKNKNYADSHSMGEINADSAKEYEEKKATSVKKNTEKVPALKEIYGEDVPAPAWQKDSWYVTCQGKPVKTQWESMLGRTYQAEPLKKGQFTMDNTVEEMKDFSLVMKIMHKAVEATVSKGFGGKKDYENPEFRMLMASSAGSPLRSMQISGGMPDGLMRGLLEMANGHMLKGILRMIRG